MEEQKSFWKKYETAIVAALTLLAVYILVISNQKLNFFLGNELIVSLSPAQKSFSLFYENKTSIEFDVSVYNSAKCRAACEYSFSDKSRNDTLDKGNFELFKDEHFKINYELSVKRLGRGQDIYGFEVKCRSIWSLLCLTSGAEKTKTSFITVNYDLTEEEKRLKETLRKNITNLLFALADADIELQKLNQKYFELAHNTNLNNLSREKIDINGEYDRITIAVENLRSLWAVEKYSKLGSLFNESLFADIYNIRISIARLNEQIDDIVELHNSILQELESLSKNFNGLESFANMAESEEFSYDLHIAANKLESVSDDVANNTFSNYTKLTNDTSELKNQQALLIEKLKAPSALIFFEIAYSNDFNDNLLCSLRQDCRKNASLNGTMEDFGRFLSNYPDASLIKSGCSDTMALEGNYSKIRNDASFIIASRNMSFPAEESFIKTSEKFKENIIRKINNSFYESFEEIKAGNKTDDKSIKAAESILPRSKTALAEPDYNQSLNLSLYWLSKIIPPSRHYALLGKCSKLAQMPKIEILKFERISTNITYNTVPKIDTDLSDNPPICCVFSECNPCCSDACKNDPKTFPVIFLHGHSFVKENSPEYSLDSFNKLQSRLQEDGYLNVGTVSLYSKNDPVEPGTWGLSGKPATVKVSYYYDAFRHEDKYIVVPTKSENIDTYAIRLRELVEIVKDRTNKPKVNIVTHSMGGLVARRYMQIFGDNDVNKLVMIAAPNKGISGSAANYCGFIGENRECRDMLKDSLFLNKLNDNLEQPENAKIYALIGQGCKMGMDDGDGIVLSQNAKLENAKLYYVNGTCDDLFSKFLHTEILNIDNYPEVYRAVKEILRE